MERSSLIQASQAAIDSIWCTPSSLTFRLWRRSFRHAEALLQLGARVQRDFHLFDKVVYERIVLCPGKILLDIFGNFFGEIAPGQRGDGDRAARGT
jgi:hypothetical protein